MQTEQQPIIWTRPFCALIFLTILINMAFSVVFPAMPIIIRQGFSDIFITWAFISLLASRFLTANFTGGMLQRFPVSSLLGFGFFLQAVTMWLFLFANSELKFIALRILEGVFEGIVTVCLQFAVAGLATEKTRGRVMGIFSASFGIGFIIGPMIGSGLIQLGGLSWVFRGTSTLMITGVFVTLLVAKTLNQAVAGHTQPTQATSLLKKFLIPDLYKFIPYYGGAIIQRGLFIAFGILLPLYLVDKYRFESHQVGYFFTFSAIMTSILMPLTGRLAGHKLKYYIAVISLILMAVSIVGFSTSGNIVTFTCAFVVETVAFSFMVPTTMSIFMEKIDRSQFKGPIIGVASSSRDLLAIFIVLTITPLYGLSHSAPWFALATLALLAMVPYLAGARRQPVNI